MSYTTQQLGHTLKAAREAKGLSQRALSEKAGVPQSHISKIENGAVDLRVSSLVELGRVLDLELMLVPRKANSAVQAIVRSSAAVAAPADDTALQARKELKRLQNSVANLSAMYPSVTELAQLQRQVRELQHFRVPFDDLKAIRNATAAVKSFKDTAASENSIRETNAQLAALRNALAHSIGDSAESDSVRPAYSLDGDDHG